MKAALYIRVSTQEQVENYSIESQRERLKAHCVSKDWTVYDTYVDGGYSGATTERPALQKMLKDLDKFDAVVVYKLDRLSRSQRDTLELIEEYFLKNNVEFVSVTETLDTSTPFGKAMIGILSVFAQLERETIAERMRIGHIKRAEAGLRVMGGDYDPAGFKRHNGDLIPIEVEKKHIQDAFNLYEELHSITKVQSELKRLGYDIWRFRRYRDILSNPLYAGFVTFAGKTYKGQHEQFISEKQFQRVQTLLSRHKGHNAHKAKKSLLSGLIVCKKCGENYHTYQTNDKGRTYRYYICRARRFPSEYENKCMNKTWNYNKLESLIIDQIHNLSYSKQLVKIETPKINYDKQLKKLDSKIEKLIDLYSEDKIEKEILDKQIDKIDLEKRQIYKAVEAQERLVENEISAEQLNQYFIDLTTSDFEKKQAIIEKLVKQISIDGDNVDITWNFNL
ncbi:recombinase family protein [Bacillus spizizenii]|uniref:recombinase family protein n=1 Tax=Bacillus inaquosorum TaxID=483913 RepID=UPI002280CEE6|nr:recombinase family protein [Bacillus inaquosorum]MCY8324286.1 recombinase family protein [Bacillus spizizenii]MCY9071875.1 recombinase family protein [Bacillus inaquosorum]MEC0661435.1 recombinase family protein [Bacillus spizizenii]MEC0703029.1 recombinase family protein [Bacillus spizizenii]